MRRGADHRGGPTDGYALVEIALALMLIGMLAAVALPGLVRATGPAALRVAAFQVAALLRDARSDALRSGRTSVASVAADGRSVIAGAPTGSVALPAGATAGLRQAGNRNGGRPTLSFYADGRSSGGDVVIMSAASRMVVAVSADSGAIHVVAP